MRETCNHVTIYLEDTDAQGIVYHANYLKYCERGRTDLLKLNGYTLGESQRQGVRFVVFEMQLRFLQPARLHDELEVRTTGVRSSDYRIVFKHQICRKDAAEALFVADAIVVAIDDEGELCPVPDDLLR